MDKPIVAVTMGDPAGVGPEVVLKALAHPVVRKVCYPIIFGDWEILQRTRREIKRCPKLVLWETGQPIAKIDRAVPVRCLSEFSAKQLKPRAPSKAGGEAVYSYIKAAAEMVLSEKADAIATAPISKTALRLAGYPYPGHTELLAALSHTKECRMMLLGKRLRVVLVTMHIPLSRVARVLTRGQIRVTVELTYQALRKLFAISRPRIAVAALNPHGGEEGILGVEEQKIILPAVKQAVGRRVPVDGPLPADSLFPRAARGDYDAVVCMYHDQGLIPVKLLHFLGGAALTLGLPFVRTSVDHGTAYDIAGKNRADESSMKEAILLAAKLSWNKKKRRRQ